MEQMAWTNHSVEMSEVSFGQGKSSLKWTCRIKESIIRRLSSWFGSTLVAGLSSIDLLNNGNGLDEYPRMILEILRRYYKLRFRRNASLNDANMLCELKFAKRICFLAPGRKNLRQKVNPCRKIPS